MPTVPPRFTAVIPCRLGSQGVKGKNTSTLAGKPLVCHAVEAAINSDAVTKTIVWTNDPAVRGIVESRYAGVEVWARPEWTDKPTATIDELATHIDGEIGEGNLVIVQPTVVPAATFLNAALRQAPRLPPGRYTVTAPVEGLVWVEEQQVGERVNRQWQREPTVHREVGVRVVTGVGDWKELPVHVAENQWVDIDEPADLERARTIARRPLIVAFNVLAQTDTGFGHLYRCMEIATEIQDESIVFLGSANAQARRILTERGWTWLDDVSSFACDVMVVDRLDTTRTEMARITAAARRVVTIENQGDGAHLADWVINDMYGAQHGNTETGFKWVVLRPEFRGLPPFDVRDNIRRVLVTFGGTDPAHMTEWAGTGLAWIPNIEVRVVKPPGREIVFPDDTDVELLDSPNMCREMRRADIVVCSAGRTLLEVAAVGVPALTVTQNDRERRHVGLHRIGWYLGPARKGLDLLGPLNDLADRRIREDMSSEIQKLIDGRGVERIVRLIKQLGLD